MRLPLLLLALVALGCGKPEVGLAPGNLAPDLKVHEVGSGKEVALKDLRGKVVLLDFWATWCGPCRSLEPEIQAAYEKHKGDLQIVAISQEPIDELERFSRRRATSYPIYHDFSGDANQAYDVEAIPYQVIIGKDGNIVWKQVGAEPGSLTEAIEKAL